MTVICRLTIMWHHLYCVFTYIYSLLIEEEICDCRNISSASVCLFVSFIWISLQFFSKSFLFLLLFLCFLHFGTFPFHMVSNRKYIYYLYSYPIVAQNDVALEEVGSQIDSLECAAFLAFAWHFASLHAVPLKILTVTTYNYQIFSLL